MKREVKIIRAQLGIFPAIGGKENAVITRGE